MKILGIDPGYERLGVAIIETTKARRETIIFSTCLTTPRTLTFEERLIMLAEQFEQIVERYRPEILAMEKIFFANNQKTALAVAEVRGVITYLACKRRLRVINLTPLQVKNSVTGYGQASKDQVKNMVERLLALKPGGRQDDEIDALAIALAGLARANGTYPQDSAAPTIAKKSRYAKK